MPELYASFKSWNRRFAIISLRHEQFMKNLKLPKHGFPTKFPIRFLRDLMDEANSRGLRWKWKKFNPRRQMEIWPELMLKTLQFRPEKVLKVLAGTYFQEPFPPPYALSDCLNYAVRYFLGGTKSPSKALVRNIFNAVYGLLLELAGHFAAFPIGLAAVAHQEFMRRFAGEKGIVLAQVSEPQFRMADDLADIEFDIAQQHAKQRAFSGAVSADESDFDIVDQRGFGAVEQHLVAVAFASVLDL